MTTSGAATEQLALLKDAAKSRRPKPVTVATDLPIARVVVDLPLAHLDRPFDYLVPTAMSDAAQPGCRIKVRFAGRDVDAFIIERADSTEHVGKLASIRRVVSAERVLTPAVLALCRAVADRYAGTLSDVTRLAVPPRHARVEAEEVAARQPPIGVPPDSLAEAWSAEPGGAAFLARLSAGEGPRAVWSAPARADWPHQLATAVAATLTAGRGSIVCVPDVRDVARIDEALTALLGSSSHVVLTADLGPAARYRAFLALARGQVQVAVGTRSAAFAPVRDLGLVAIWDDGDDLFAEPRAPYPHAREVLLLRAHEESAGALVGATNRSIEAQQLVQTPWAADISAPRDTVRALAPQVHVTGEYDREPDRDAAGGGARVPKRVFEVVRDALAVGPVLVHVPRAGYLPALTCDNCRQPARCMTCSGPLARRDAGVARCLWCERPADGWRCRHCTAPVLRAPVIGALRTAEEWGRAFPQTTVVRSGGDHVIGTVDDEPAIVIATPGAEPLLEGGYAAAVILDSWLSLGRPELRASEEALRRWLNVAAMVRSGSDGGRVIAVGEPANAVLQALVRWDPVGYAVSEAAERASARLPPSVRLATLEGAPDLVTTTLASLELPRYVEAVGPIDIGSETSRLVLRTDRRYGAQLSVALQQLQATASARKVPSVKIHVDPVDFG